jgi:hypothetical protein
VPIAAISCSILLALLKKADVLKTSSKGKNGQLHAVEFLLKITAMPSRTDHFRILICRSRKRPFKLLWQYGTPQIRLIVQSFVYCIFDILECHDSRTKNVLAIQHPEKYKRHRPETTFLYKLVERYYPEFTVKLAEQGKHLPKYVEREFDEFLRCGRLDYGFLRVAAFFKLLFSEYYRI